MEPGTLPFVDEVHVFLGNRLACVPVFDTNTLIIDWEYSRLPRGSFFCLPGACTTPISTALSFQPDTPWSLEERSIVVAIELVTTRMRSDVSTLFDDLHLSRGMYIDAGNGLRSWCTPIYATFRPSLSPCTAPGYSGNPCRICEEDFYCPGGNLKFACPPAQTSQEGSTELADCFECRADQFLDKATLRCMTCLKDHFCIQETLFACPANAYCPGGLSMPICQVGEWFDVEELTCVKLGDTTCQKLKANDDEQRLIAAGGCPGPDCTCSEEAGRMCH
eukprot:400450-Rhodomonas_salina.1